MQSLIGYQRADSVATITMDDGKVNVLSSRMIAEINDALDQAQHDAAAVILAGRDGVFSAGFDLPVIRAGGPAATGMLRAGFDLAERMLSYPRPIVIACTGHAVAMGAFLLLSGDYRVGVAGPYKITANEVAIGLTLPRAAVEICRQRLTPAHFNRATVLAETFQPDGAVEAGFLDRACQPADFWQAVRGIAAELAGLDLDAHQATKLRVRRAALAAVHDAIAADSAALAADSADSAALAADSPALAADSAALATDSADSTALATDSTDSTDSADSAALAADSGDHARPDQATATATTAATATATATAAAAAGTPTA